MLGNISLIRRVVGVILLSLPILPAAGAQDLEGKGHIKGHVADRAGAAVANNKITFENATSKFETTSDDKGLFELKLPAGVYQVTTEKAAGFEPIKLSKVRVKPDKFTMLHIQLQADGQDATCDVKTAAPPAKDKMAEKKSKP